MKPEDRDYLAYAAKSIEYVFAWTASGRELVHDYLGIDLESVWEVIDVHLRALQPQVQRMLADAEQRPHS